MLKKQAKVSMMIDRVDDKIVHRGSGCCSIRMRMWPKSMILLN